MSETKPGDTGICEACSGPIYSAGAWWAHRVSPADGHEAQPAQVSA